MKLTIAEIREEARSARDALDGPFDVRAVSIECRSTHPLVPGPFEVNPSLRVKGRQTGDQVDVHARYQLQADTTGDDPTMAWTLTIEMVATWAIGNARLSQRELSSFAMTTGVDVIHPYAREAVQATIGRVGYPPFTMEMLTSLLDQDDDFVIDWADLPDSDES